MSIERQRICRELSALGEFGFVPGEGTSRVAYSQSFLQGRDYVKALMEEAGLQVFIDGVGNLIGRKEGKLPGSKIISVGSHIDSVPGGGIYDGCLGVLGGIECIRAMKREGYTNRHPIEVIAFIEEEGNAIGGTFGSRCFVGEALSEEEIKKAASFGMTLEDIRSAKGKAEDYEAYLELHIEQGGVLESKNLEIGIVEGIVGIARFDGLVEGETNHAGTTPMSLRKDAMTRSVNMLDDLYDRVLRRKDGMVCTVGEFRIVSPAVNVVPGKTRFTLEVRNPHMEEMLKVVSAWEANYEPQGLKLQQFLQQDETMMDGQLLDKMEGICCSKRLSFTRMYSGAGHDAMNMAGFTPSGMIFIPSVDGRSHCIEEFSKEEDIGNGTEVLFEMIKTLDLA